VEFAIYNGDVNQDGTIDGTDTQIIDNDAYNFESGYIVPTLMVIIVLMVQTQQ